MFMADLIRAIPLDMTCHFLRVTSLREEAARARCARTSSTPPRSPTRAGDILLLDDIVDTGITLNFLLDHIRERRPRSLKVCALIDKPGDRKIDVQLDWAAFTLKEPMADRFLVGLRPGLRRALPRAAVHRNHSPPGAAGRGATITISPGS